MTFRLESKRIPYTRARPRPYPLLPYLTPVSQSKSDLHRARGASGLTDDEKSTVTRRNPCR
jgi:hypothetical protein